MDTLSLPYADDLHVHLRQGKLMRQVAQLLRPGGVGRVLVMPNLKPPLTTVGGAHDYQAVLEIMGPGVEFLMTLYLTDAITPRVIIDATEAGIVGVKRYPRGVTTHSDDGVEGFEEYYPVFEAMQAAGLILCLHGEEPSDAEANISILNAEEKFLVKLARLHQDFPKLRIVLEHVTTQAAVDAVRACGDTVAATITAHHLDLTIDDWAGKNHNFCKPVAKTPRDREALRSVVAQGHHRFFLGSDSAPHPRHDKEGAEACAGVYTSPLLLPYLVTTFEELDILDRLEDFTSRFGAAFYGLSRQKKMVTLERRAQRVPPQIGEVVPYRAGDTLNWTVVQKG